MTATHTTARPDSTPAGLEDAEIYVRADHPDQWGRWYVRADDSVVYRWPSGRWNERPLVSATLLRTSPVWAREQAGGA